MQEMFPPRSSTTFVATFSWFWNVALCANALLRWVDKSHSVLGKKQCQVFGTTWLVLLLEKCATDLMKMFHRLWENEPPTLGKWAPTLGKWATDFGEICHRFWGNPSPALPTLWKSVADLRKSATDFVEIRYRFWVNPSPILPPTLEKSATGFVKLRFQEKTSFWEKPGVSKKEANRWEVGRVNGSNLPTLMSKLFWGLC